MSSDGIPPAIVATNDEKNLLISFIQFLRHKMSSSPCSPDQAEGIEVAVQCMEAAFGLTDANYAFQPSKPLLDIFIAAEGLPQGETSLPVPTEAEISEANRLKEEGNALMKSSQFDAAVSKYNEAIKLNREPAYFCNRAAAYCRLEQYDLAIQDCRAALALDPKYSKAYGRMGLALSCQKRYDQAVDKYKKAIELDPNQESYRNNLKIAEEKLKELQNSNNFNIGGSQYPMQDVTQLLNNPAMINMASQMMSDPGIQTFMSQMMSNLVGGAQGGSLGNLMQAGQQLAQQMQSQNPELMERLRQQFGGPVAEGQTDNKEDEGHQQ